MTRKKRNFLWAFVAVGLLIAMGLASVTISSPASAAPGDVTIDADATANHNTVINNGGPVWTSLSTAYAFYLSGPKEIAYRKTITGGQTWGPEVSVFSGITVRKFVLWYDRWTPGDTGDLIRMAYVARDSGAAVISVKEYISLDTSTDTLSTPVDFNAPGGVDSAPNWHASGISITKSRAGNLFIGGWIDTGEFDNLLVKSSNGGATWEIRESVADGTAIDKILLLPGNETELDDIWAIYLDVSVAQLSLKVYDDSLDSWSEQFIEQITGSSATYFQFAASVRHSDGHAIVVAWTTVNDTTADLIAFDIGGAGSITSLTDLHTNQNIAGDVGITIDQSTDNIYVVHLHGGSWEDSVGVFYHRSIDGGATWRAEERLNEAPDDDIRWVRADISVGASGGRWMPVWHNQDTFDVLANFNKSIILAPQTLTVASVIPAEGPVAGGTSVEINGAGFAVGATVTFGGVPATGVNVASTTAITVITPANPAGAADVLVTNPGSQFGTLFDGFTYLPPMDVVIDASAQTTLHRRGVRSLVWTGTSTGYVVYIDSTNEMVYRKTTDGGSSWGSPVVIMAAPRLATAYSLWYDRWTPGDQGTVIHVAYADFVNDRVQYRNLDTSTDTLGIERGVFSGVNAISNSWDQGIVDITKARGGNLYVGFWINNTGERGFRRSTDGGNTWTGRAALADGAAVDRILLVPGNEANPQDIWSIYWDVSADEISLKVYDDSANSWSESLISGGMNERFTGLGLGISAAPRHSDGHTVLTALTDQGLNNADLRVWDLESSSTFTPRANVFTAEQKHTGVALLLDRGTDDLYVAYSGDPADPSFPGTFNIYFKRSADGGATWGPRAKINVGPGPHFGLWAGVSVNGGRFQPVWFDNSVDDLITNFDNSIALAEAAPAPTINTLLPDEGPGGTFVLILGNDFADGFTVSFGGVVAATTTFKTSSLISAITPANPAGPVEVVVTNPDGQTDTESGGFTYVTLIRGLVEDGLGQPLPEVSVDLLFAGNPIDTTTTDASGRYQFPDGLPVVEPAAYRIQINLRHDNATTSDPILRVQHGEPPVPAFAKSSPFSVTSGEVTEVDINFATSALTTGGAFPDDRLDDLAATYVHSMQAFTYARDELGFNHDLMLPIDVLAFNGPRTPPEPDIFYRPNTGNVVIKIFESGVVNANRPMNREWHEMFHELMDDAFGIPTLPAGDENHDGFANTSTSDSWAEGWAEFWATQVKEHLGEPNPNIYVMKFRNFNLDINYLAFQPDPGDREEFAVAGLLLDLVDGVNLAEDDAIDIDPVSLWDMIGIPPSPLVDMKDVYDGLVSSAIGAGDTDSDGLTDLDEVFVAHGFFSDNGDGLYDPQTEQVGFAANLATTTVGTVQIPPRPDRRNTPPTPGTGIQISVVDELGQPINEGTVEVSIEFQPGFEFYDFSYSKDLASVLNADGVLGIEPPPGRFPATTSIQILTPTSGVSDSLAFSNDTFWQAVEDTEIDFVGVHDFDLSKAGQTTNLKLVTMDIKPGSNPNCINLGSEGFIPVAILTTEIFDAADVDQTSLFLEGAAARVKGKSGNIGSFEDVDGDGDLDLVVQFPTADLQLTEDDTEAVLEGLTLSGIPIQATDPICVVP